MLVVFYVFYSCLEKHIFFYSVRNNWLDRCGGAVSSVFLPPSTFSAKSLQNKWVRLVFAKTASSVPFVSGR